MLLVLLLFAVVAEAQQQNYREMHKVKKGETLFGIARRYEITVDQLIKANPDMNAVGYELKKGDYIFIPYPDGQKPSATQKPAASQKAKDDKTVRVGIMLPLHNVDGDGRRMIEYYRGFLMGCDELKKAGQDVEVMAWNVPIDANISQTLAKEGADRCDVIFGPLYSAQVAPLAAFAKQHGIASI